MTPWASECEGGPCWSIRIASVPKRLVKGSTFTVRLEGRVKSPTTRRGAEMKLVFLDVSAPDYSSVPEIDVVSMEVIRGGERIKSFGRCDDEIVRDPRTGFDRRARTCLTSNPEGRIWTGTEVRILRLKYRGGIKGLIPPGASLLQPVFLLGLAQTTYLPTEQVLVQYGR